MAAGPAQRRPYAANVLVEWGNDAHCIALTWRNWRKVSGGRPLVIRGRGCGCASGWQWEYWHFNTTAPGSLRVEYGSEESAGVGFDGSLDDAIIRRRGG